MNGSLNQKFRMYIYNYLCRKIFLDLPLLSGALAYASLHFSPLAPGCFARGGSSNSDAGFAFGRGGDGSIRADDGHCYYGDAGVSASRVRMNGHY